MLGESSYASRVSNSFVLTRCSSVRSLLPSHTDDFHLSASFGAGFHLWKASKYRFTEFQQHSPIRTSRHLVPPDSVDQALGTGLLLACGRARACGQQAEGAADEFGFWGGGEVRRRGDVPPPQRKKKEATIGGGRGGKPNLPTPRDPPPRDLPPLDRPKFRSFPSFTPFFDLFFSLGVFSWN